MWKALLGMTTVALLLAATASGQWVKGFKAPHYTGGSLKVAIGVHQIRMHPIREYRLKPRPGPTAY